MAYIKAGWLGRLKYVFNLSLMSKTFTIIFIMRGSTCVASSLCSVYIWLPFFQKLGSITFTKPKDIAMVCSFKCNCRPTWQTQTFILLSWVPEEEQCFLMASHECLSFVKEFQWLTLTVQRSNRQENCGFEKPCQYRCCFLRSFISLALFFQGYAIRNGCIDW